MTKQYSTIVLVGYAKAGPLGNRGQLISASVGSPSRPGEWMDVELGKGEGEYLHERTKRPFLWWYSCLWLEEGDLVRISTKVGVAGQGPDYDRTMDMVFCIDPSVGVVQLDWKNLGYKEYPLAKGYLREISRTSRAMEYAVSTVIPLVDSGGTMREVP